MRMHNPPHPGLGPPRVSRRYGRVRGRGTSAGHARDPVASAEWQSGNFRQDGSPPGSGTGTSPDLWINMQAQYDLWRARRGRQPAVRRFPHVAGHRPC